jgi:DNA-binding CsgD family transcriptional regulator
MDEKKLDAPLIINLIEHLQDIIVVENLNHEFVLSNSYTAKLFGYKDVDAMLGVNAHGMRCPAVESADRFIEQDKLVIEQKSTLNLLDIHCYADGKIRVLMTQKSPILEGDMVKYTVCHCREIKHNTLQKVSQKIVAADQKITGSESQSSYRLVSEQGKLSKREMEILFFLLRGKSASQIADALFLSKRTVENHLANMKQKLHCQKKSDLVEYGINKGFMSIIPESLLKRDVSLLID